MGGNIGVDAEDEALTHRVDRTSGVDTTIIGYLKYIGDEDSATYEVNAAGDLLLKHGDASAEAADTDIQVGATPGTIDVSDADANTAGEFEDYVNASANWRFLRMVPRSWSMNGLGASAGNGTLLAASAAVGNLLTDGGQALYADASELAINLALPSGAADCYAIACCVGEEERTALKLDDRRSYPLGEMRHVKTNQLHWAKGNLTSGGTMYFAVIGVDRLGNERYLVAPRAGAATTVDYPWPASGMETELRGEPGEQVIVLYACTGAAPSAGNLDVHGLARRQGATPQVTGRTEEWG